MVELQKNLSKIEAASIQVVAVSYDSVDVLAKFSERQNITFPLLSDPDSKAIKAYGVINKNASGRLAGIPHPGSYLIDQKGIVRAILPGTVRKRHSSSDLLDAASKSSPSE